MSSEIVKSGSGAISSSVDAFSNSLQEYLVFLGLPDEGVLVPVAERAKVINNLPAVVQQVPVSSLPQSVYISKFVAACTAGLFDAALNFLWDETVKNLRQKVVRFDLEYFYDSVIASPDRRKKLKTEADLTDLDDWELVRGCHLTGILSDIGFKHLDYIRNMRNWASAAHPNQNDLTGLQLVSWLETCVKEVIAVEPSGPVLEVGRLLHNVRTCVLSAGDIPPIASNIALLPGDLVTSLLRTLFGMFIDPDVSTETKNNIRLIADSAWSCAPEESRQELGVKYSVLAANGEIARRDGAREFLQMVDGLTYLPEDTRVVEMTEKISNLYEAHTGFNNFHAEPAHARALEAYVPDTGQVPDAVRYPYVKTVVMCDIGNGYGVSDMAYPYYERLIARFQDTEIAVFCRLPLDSEFASRLQFSRSAKGFQRLAAYLKDRTSSAKLRERLEFIESRTEPQVASLGKVTEYKELVGAK